MKKLMFCTLFCVSVLICAHQSVHTQAPLSKSVIRLHILANSDTAKDQLVKLKVRDAILQTFSSAKCSEKSIQENLETARLVANQVLKDNGFAYTATANYGIFDFPAKHYNNITLPAGRYQSLQIRLGDSNGQNWWCVMYPPLCLNDMNATFKTAKDNVITFDIKFKLAEIFNFS